MRSIHSYVLVVCLAALGTGLLHDWALLGALERPGLYGLLALFALALLSESLALTVTIAKNAGTSSITFIPVLACQILFGTPASIVLLLSVGGVVEAFIRRKQILRLLFNLGQLTLGVSLGGVAYRALGGYALALEAGNGSPAIVSQLVPFAVFTIIFLLTNHAAVSQAIAIDQDISFRRVWKNRAGRSGANILYDFLISPIALAVAFLFVELGSIGIFVALLPLLFIRRAYLANYELQQANRDLLKALVKAIETRDPYTSGHSIRVSKLGRRIAEEVGLGRNEIEHVETAALLHDIGKIDSGYAEILRKPGALTEKEREIIESHVEKGVELIKSLTSFGNEVIAAVRHHHERVDGKGYPDGLAGKEIPIGARIIKVCDAIDAMLSDRPYRDALDLSDVHQQLSMHAGSQFDSELVHIITSTNVIEEHRQAIGHDGENQEIKESTSLSLGISA